MATAAWLICLLAQLAATGLAIRTMGRQGPPALSLPKSGWNVCATPVEATSATSKAHIPKILHQTYKSRRLPLEFERWRKTWLQLAPDWEYHLWTDDDNRKLVEEHYPWFLDTYDRYEWPIERVDAARIFMLHRYGGVYADLDVEALQDPTAFIRGEDDLAFFYDHEYDHDIDKPGVTNSIMASTPGHPFWIRLAERMVWSRREVQNKNIWCTARLFWSTGPVVFTRMMYREMQEHPETNVGIYPARYWTPFAPNLEEDPCEYRPKCKAAYPDAILVSHWSGSWHKHGEFTDNNCTHDRPVSMSRKTGLCE